MTHEEFTIEGSGKEVGAKNEKKEGEEEVGKRVDNIDGNGEEGVIVNLVE